MFGCPSYVGISICHSSNFAAEASVLVVAIVAHSLQLIPESILCMICMWYIYHRCSFYWPISVTCLIDKWLHIILFLPISPLFLIQWWRVNVVFIRFISHFRSSQLFAALMHICDHWFGNHSHWLWIVIPNCQKSSSSYLLAQSIPFDFVW